MRQRLPFLIPGLLYALLALITLGYGLYLLRPAIEYARVHHLPGIEATPRNAETLKLLFIPPLYAVMAFFILKRCCRTLAIIGAVFSLFYIPLGTVLGLIFLFWTRRAWPPKTSQLSSRSSQ